MIILCLHGINYLNNLYHSSFGTERTKSLRLKGGVSTGAEGQVFPYNALPSALAKVCTMEENRCGMLGTSWDFLANDLRRFSLDGESAAFHARPWAAQR